MKKSILILLSIAAFILGYIIYDPIFNIISGRIETEIHSLKMATQFYQNLSFAIFLGLLPIVLHFIWGYLQYGTTKKKVLSTLLVIMLTIGALIFRIEMINNRINEYVSSTYTVSYALEDCKIVMWMALGTVVGVLILWVFRKRKS